VTALRPPGASGAGTVYLVSDLGVKYALGGEDSNAVKTKLGYEGVTPVGVPDLFLDLIPTGPALDPDDALRPVGVPAGPTSAAPGEAP
jgi:hypothetical protein